MLRDIVDQSQTQISVIVEKKRIEAQEAQAKREAAMEEQPSAERRSDRALHRPSIGEALHRRDLVTEKVERRNNQAQKQP